MNEDSMDTDRNEERFWMKAEGVIVDKNLSYCMLRYWSKEEKHTGAFVFLLQISSLSCAGCGMENKKQIGRAHV